VVLESELRALCLWGRCSTTWAIPPFLFALAIYEIGSHFYSGQPGLPSSYFMLPALAGIIGVYHHTQLFPLRCSFMNLLFGVALNCSPPNLTLPSSLNYSHELPGPGMNLLFFFWWTWGLNSQLCTCKAGALPLEAHLQSILLWLFWRWGKGGCMPPAWDDLEPRSSWSQLPKQLGLQLWSTSTQLWIYFLNTSSLLN
jgi:hypothetical protein